MKWKYSNDFLEDVVTRKVSNIGPHYSHFPESQIPRLFSDFKSLNESENWPQSYEKYKNLCSQARKYK